MNMDYQGTLSPEALAALYTTYNLKMVEALKAFREVRKSMIESVDEATGKVMSAVKADVLADATPEAATYELSRAHVNNIEIIIKVLTSSCA